MWMLLKLLVKQEQLMDNVIVSYMNIN